MAAAKFNLDMLAAQGLGVRAFAADEKIFVTGDPGDSMYVVESGTIQIVSYGTILENVNAGDIFGEMALLDDGARSATAIAVEPSSLIAVDKIAFYKLVQRDPSFALEVMRRLAERLRRMNESL